MGEDQEGDEASAIGQFKAMIENSDLWIERCCPKEQRRKNKIQ